MVERIILVAMTRERVIGRGNRLPWHIPAELRLFRELTTGHTLIMGRRTYEAIGRPLPQRRNLVLSRTRSPEVGAEICRDFEEAVARAAGDRKVFFIGGRDVFARALSIADLLRVSWIEGKFPGNVYFPEIEWGEWEVVEERVFPGFTHAVYRRRAGAP